MQNLNYFIELQFIKKSMSNPTYDKGGKPQKIPKETKSNTRKIKDKILKERLPSFKMLRIPHICI